MTGSHFNKHLPPGCVSSRLRVRFLAWMSSVKHTTTGYAKHGTSIIFKHPTYSKIKYWSLIWIKQFKSIREKNCDSFNDDYIYSLSLLFCLKGKWAGPQCLVQGSDIRCVQHSWLNRTSLASKQRTFSVKFQLVICMWLGGRVVRILDLESTGRKFESWPLRCRVQPWASC